MCYCHYYFLLPLSLLLMNLFICSLLILLFLVFRLDKINEQINNIQTDTLTYLHDSQLPPQAASLWIVTWV